MPIRLLLLLVTVLAAFLYITFLNPRPVELNYYPGLRAQSYLSIISLGSFCLGVVSVFALYFYDSILETISGWRKSAQEKRAGRVRQMREDAEESLALDNRSGAEKLYRKALAHDPAHVPSLVALGKLRREDGDLAEAIELHSRARAVEPENVMAALELAEDYVRARSLNAALAILRECRESAGRSIPPLAKIRDIYLLVGNYEEALEIQKEVAALAPVDRAEEERSLVAAFIYQIARGRLKSGDFDNAMEGFRAALRADESFTPAVYELAATLNRTGRRSEALKTLRKGFKSTRSPALLRSLVDALLEEGLASEAEEELLRAQDLYDEDTINLMMADVRLRSGDPAGSRDALDHIEGALADCTFSHLIRARIRRGENNVDWALAALDKAYEAEADGLFIHICSACGHVERGIFGRCAKCGRWNTGKPTII
ncbi:MAG: tetratricopeptide repeat protein [Nitrospinae bacterium]|nr:tetratricopeptide repeat protein [Nitrospinota bacterium]